MRTKQMRDFFFLLLLLLLFLEAKAGIRKSDEKNSVMRDFREKGAGMRDQDPSPTRLPLPDFVSIRSIEGKKWRKREGQHRGWHQYLDSCLCGNKQKVSFKKTCLFKKTSPNDWFPSRNFSLRTLEAYMYEPSKRHNNYTYNLCIKFRLKIA